MSRAYCAATNKKRFLFIGFIIEGGERGVKESLNRVMAR